MSAGNSYKVSEHISSPSRNLIVISQYSHRYQAGKFAGPTLWPLKDSFLESVTGCVALSLGRDDTEVLLKSSVKHLINVGCQVILVHVTQVRFDAVTICTGCGNIVKEQHNYIS